MSNHEWESMNERDFETMLEKSVLDFPPDDVVEDVTPWRKAMSRVLIGMALCAITLNLLVPKLYSSCRWNGAVTIRVSFSMA